MTNKFKKGDRVRIVKADFIYVNGKKIEHKLFYDRNKNTIFIINEIEGDKYLTYIEGQEKSSRDVWYEERLELAFQPTQLEDDLFNA